MKDNNIQTKRDVGKKAGFKILHARIKRKKQRAVAATPEDLGADVPNVGIGRALLVILVLHIVAIGAIVMHSSWRSSDAANQYVSDTPNNTSEKIAGAELLTTSNTQNTSAVAITPTQPADDFEEIVEPVHSIIPSNAQIQPVVVAEPVLPAIESIPRAEIATPDVVESNLSLVVHEVKSGDTLWGISQKYKMKVADLKSLNSLSNNSIKPGQRLKVHR